MKTIEFENKAVKELNILFRKNELNALGLSRAINIPPARISEMLSGKRRITPASDVCLCEFFKLKYGHFLKLQIDYEVEMVCLKLGDKLLKIKTIDEILK